MKSTRSLSTLIGLSILAASCATATPPAEQSEPTTTTRATSTSTPPEPTLASPKESPELLAACGLVQFDAASIDTTSFDPFTGDIESLMGDEATEEYEASREWWDALDWSEAESTQNSLLLFGQLNDPQDERPPFGFARFERVGQDWEATGWGECRIVTSAEGFGVATFILDPDNPVDPAATTLQLLATERACASGMTPNERQILPVVVETAEAVEVTVLVEEPGGPQSCPMSPPFFVTVELGSPLGDRVIRDGAIHPAELRS